MKLRNALNPVGATLAAAMLLTIISGAVQADGNYEKLTIYFTRHAEKQTMTTDVTSIASHSQSYMVDTESYMLDPESMPDPVTLPMGKKSKKERDWMRCVMRKSVQKF